MNNAPDMKDARQHRLDYTRVNLRTGRISTDSQYFLSARDALEHVDKWNRQQPDEWLYVPVNGLDYFPRNVAYALKACAVLIYGDAKDGADHLQWVINLARIGLGCDPLPPEAPAPGRSPDNA